MITWAMRGSSGEVRCGAVHEPGVVERAVARPQGNGDAVLPFQFGRQVNMSAWSVLRPVQVLGARDEGHAAPVDRDVHQRPQADSACREPV
ncbi:hypothetical protein GCM10022214_01350 [Actinomadura miaoliensis]|uniref:Uncharacterized protein n=1 Tax=Actinomadura miaoliensis TaxID=430685 RepID=A0ABP7UWF5_9ACTN